MKRSAWIGCVAALLTGLVGCQQTSTTRHPEALVAIIGDQHSAYERTAQFVGLVDQLKREHPALPLAVLIDGDSQEYGNALAQRTQGAIDFAMYAALARRAPTILNLGNHETEFFDGAEVVQRIRATGVQVVSNLGSRTTGLPFATPAVPLKLGRHEATVVGITTDNLATYRVAVRPSLDLANPVVWAKAKFPRLFAEASLPIVLSHAGITSDREILPLVPDGTLYAGAHDHQRCVESFGRTVYVHSGSWNSHASLAWLERDTSGKPTWRVEQVAIQTDGPADAELAAFIAKTQAAQLTEADRAVVGHTSAALPPTEAARWAAAALRDAAGIDAAFIGNTTFGGGLPAGDVTRLQFDACVRFDGTVYFAEVTGERLQTLLAAANLTPETPFAQRRGEFNVAAGPQEIDPARTYRIATTDWGAKNTARYFGAPAIVWQEQAEMKVKATVLTKLSQ